MNLVIENLHLSDWKELTYLGRKRPSLDVIRTGKFETGINVFDLEDYGFHFVEELTKGKEGRRSSKEKIYLNGKKVSFKKIKEMSCYVGYDMARFPDNILKTRIKRYIKRGLRKSKIKYSYEDIVDMFGLKEPFLSWDLCNATQYGLIYLFAINFAKGKKIFGLNPLSHTLMKEQKDFSVIDKIAESEDLIVLIATNTGSEFMEKEISFNYKVTELRWKL